MAGRSSTPAFNAFMLLHKEEKLSVSGPNACHAQLAVSMKSIPRAVSQLVLNGRNRYSKQIRELTTNVEFPNSRIALPGIRTLYLRSV